MIPEFVTALEHPCGFPVRLFINPETGEGAVIASEIAGLMDYASLSFLCRAKECAEHIHFFVLAGTSLRIFKERLAGQDIRAYRRSTRLLFITETGIALLLGKRCKEKAMRVGQWLVTHALPRFHADLGRTCYQKVQSRYLNRTLHVFVHQGRLAVLGSQIFSVTGPLDCIAKGVNAYIPDIHWNTSTQEFCQALTGMLPAAAPNDWIFYPSGLYRYWSHIRHPLVPLMKIAFETEIWPHVRQGEWTILEDTPTEVRAMEPVPVYSDLPPAEGTEVGRLRDSLEPLLRRLETLQEALNDISPAIGEWRVFRESLAEWQEGFLSELTNRLGLAGRSGKDESLEGDRVAVEEVTSLSLVKKIARELGFYYMDKITPHLVFTRALLEYAGSTATEYLGLLAETQLQIRSGENTVTLMKDTYRIWKK